MGNRMPTREQILEIANRVLFPPTINKGVAKRILRVRSHYNITQARFGGALSITNRYVSMMETGKRRPSGSLVKLISSVFRVEETWLRTGRGKRGF